MDPVATDDVRRLLDAAALGRGATDSAVAEIGAERTARILVDEVAFRAALDELRTDGGPLSIEFTLHGAGQQVQHTLVVGDADAGEHPLTTVRQDLAELAVCLFGPRAAAAPVSFELRWPTLWSDAKSLGVPPPPGVLEVGRRIHDVVHRRGDDGLSRLAVRHRSDKWGAHRYTPRYERHFAALTDRRMTVLEIGVGEYEGIESAPSLRMWKGFFPRALVYGIDLHDKSTANEQRVHTMIVDQSDAAALAEVGERLGPFDIVIDDGSHVSGDVITSFETLFPYVTPGGLYAIEDLQTSYWPLFGGNDADLDDRTTSMGYIKSLVDGLNHEEFLPTTQRERRPHDAAISGIFLYHNLAFLEKGGNHEGSPIAGMFDLYSSEIHAS